MLLSSQNWYFPEPLSLATYIIHLHLEVKRFKNRNISASIQKLYTASTFGIIKTYLHEFLSLQPTQKFRQNNVTIDILVCLMQDVGKTYRCYEHGKCFETYVSSLRCSNLRMPRSKVLYNHTKFCSQINYLLRFEYI